MKPALLRILPALALLSAIASCTWSPKVVHPGLGDAGAGLGKNEKFEIGASSYLYIPSMLRAEFRVFDRLTLSGGYGLTGPDATGVLAALNIVAVRSDRFFLTASPNLVLHDNSKHAFSGTTLGLTLTPAVRIFSHGRVYVPLFVGHYAGKIAGIENSGAQFIPGIGLDNDFGPVRIFAEANVPANGAIGTTVWLPNASIGLMLGF